MTLKRIIPKCSYFVRFASTENKNKKSIDVMTYVIHLYNIEPGLDTHLCLEI